MSLFKKIRNIEYQSEKLAEELLAGVWRSSFRGTGLEFEEVRAYQEGDDIRAIDWNVTARTGHPHVKTFREERELTLFFLVDLSSSMLFGSKHQLKQELAAELIATLSFSAIKNNDNVGLLLFSDTVEKVIPPKKGTRHVLRLIREVLAQEPHGKAHLPSALRYLGHIQKKSAICFLLTDFLYDIPTKELLKIASRHDLIALHIQDQLEDALPSLSFATFKDLETGQTITTKKAQTMPKVDPKIFRKNGLSYIPLYTNEPYLPPLKKFFQSRKVRHR